MISLKKLFHFHEWKLASMQKPVLRNIWEPDDYRFIPIWFTTFQFQCTSCNATKTEDREGYWTPENFRDT